MREMICIVCPKGCRMSVNEETPVSVTGHSCARGEEYARNEILNPVRTITSTVKISGAAYHRCPVKTDGAIPKGKIFEAMKLLNGLELVSPVHIGQAVAENICGTKSSFVVTRDM